jgi:protein phosphatase
MGGMGRGDEASKVAVESITESMRTGDGLPPDRMRAALRRADVTVREELCTGDQPGVQPGSTAVMVYVLDGAAHVAWVGDSRAYLVRDGRVVDRTRDHKLVEELVDAGQLTREEARHSSLAHVVTRALGGRDPSEPPVNAATLGYPWKLRTGDAILVCSDGLCDLVEDEELPALLAEGAPEEVTARLVQVAIDRGGHDNITCILGVWDGPDWIEEDHSTPLMQGPREMVPVPVPMDEPLEESDGRVTEEIDVAALAEMASQEGDAPVDDLGPVDDLTTAEIPIPEAPTTSPMVWWIVTAVLLALALVAALLALTR